MLFEPLHNWMKRRCGRYDRLAAGLTTIVILLIVLVPTVAVVYEGAHDAVHMVRGTEKVHVDAQSFDHLIEHINQWFGLELDSKVVRQELVKINEWLGPIAQKTPAFLADFLVGCFVFAFGAVLLHCRRRADARYRHEACAYGATQPTATD